MPCNRSSGGFRINGVRAVCDLWGGFHHCPRKSSLGGSLLVSINTPEPRKRSWFLVTFSLRGFQGLSYRICGREEGGIWRRLRASDERGYDAYQTGARVGRGSPSFPISPLTTLSASA